MKVKSIICAFSVFALCMGCSDKKDVPQSQQQVEQPIAKKKTQIPLDSSRIVTLKDFDSNDSISVGVRAFRSARKEFVKRWNYTKASSSGLYKPDATSRTSSGSFSRSVL